MPEQSSPQDPANIIDDRERALSRLNELGVGITRNLGAAALVPTERRALDPVIDCGDMRGVLGDVPRTYQDGGVYDLNTGRRIL
ncbi:hypothetical protein KC951_01985 [Candidatus Saccharibacteria bacterium]|nr:hypothetical protein [Candidatus Saccharibacteria bacterium]